MLNLHSLPDHETPSLPPNWRRRRTLTTPSLNTPTTTPIQIMTTACPPPTAPPVVGNETTECWSFLYFWMLWDGAERYKIFVISGSLGSLEMSLLYDATNNALHCTIVRARVSVCYMCIMYFIIKILWFCGLGFVLQVNGITHIHIPSLLKSSNFIHTM